MNGLKGKTASFAIGVALLSAIFLSVAVAETAKPAQKHLSSKSALESLKQQFGDLTAHPLAGSKIKLKVVVEDGLGQKGETSVEVELPQRDFKNPLNPGLAVLRRRLAEAYRQEPKTARSKARGVAADLAVLIRKQEKTIRNPASRDALNAIQKKLAAAQDVKTADQVVDDLWAVMLQLETDNMPVAEKMFLKAERDFLEGMKNGAGAEELRKLQDKAMKAADDLLREMANKNNLSADDKKALEKIRNLAQEMKDADPETMQRMMQVKEMKQGDMNRQQIEKTLKDMQRMADIKDVSKLLDDQRDLMDETMELDDQFQAERDRTMQEIQKELERSARDMEEWVDRRKDIEENRQQEIEREEKAAGGGEGKEMNGEERRNRQALEQSKANQKKLDSLKDDLGRLQDQLKKLQEDEGQTAEDEAKDVSDALDNIDDDLQKMEEMDNSDPDQKPGEGENADNPGEEKETEQPGMPETPEMPEGSSTEDKGGGQKKDGQGGKKGGGKESEKSSGKAPQSKTLKDMQESRGRASKDIEERQRRLSKELQNKAGKMQGNGKSAESMGDAAGHMDKSAEKLSKGRAGSAIPDQNKALESMRAAMAELMRSKQDGGGKDQPQDGTQKGPGGMSRAGASDISAARSQQDNAAANTVEPDVNATARIREKIQDKLKNKNITPKERQYYQDLLKGNHKTVNPPRP